MCVVLQLVRLGDSDDGGVGGSTVWMWWSYSLLVWR